ncbi:MAG TPA: hydrogen gas-evolving membrane-bound hydrogenase subunit E [Actinomycetota bacterium]|jgi:multicomponent Na+:H+ antiporter subunit A|nr:hydrogen gas-evolving membrane-bound hydrogenase subunit E [Actinomycetota bacterium]
MRSIGSATAAGVAAVALAVVSAVAVLAVWRSGGAGFDVAWLPSWGARLAFRLDGLGALYGLLATGIGVAVFAYATAYLPRHLEHEERPQAEGARFHALMALFMAAMVGLSTAQDLLLLFVFWDLTAIASYLLIGYDRQHREARLSALMALLVTGVSAVLLLIGLLMLRAEFGTTSIPALLERAQGGGAVTLAGALIAVGALAKSAQVPLHFWLPRAMAAPTPVSAYLHSAAMVAAGVFVLSRLHPLLATSRPLLDGLLVVGLVSMAVGGLLALGADHLKRLLAYSTIAQYGYVVTMLGVGGASGAAAACFYVLAHALAKSALFMTSGAVTEATGGKALSEVGGLARAMPALAAGSGLAAAGLAALPLTIGFFKDELFFKAAAERGTWLAVLAVASAALTLAYITRFWTGIFLGGLRRPARAVPARLVVPVVVLGGLVLAGGLVVAPFAALSEDAAQVTAAAPVAVAAAYHLDFRAENVMALAAYALGLVLVAGRPALAGVLAGFARLGRRAGPERAYVTGLAALNRLSNAIHDVELRDLRTRVVAVLVPAGALVGIGVVVTPFEGAYLVGSFTRRDLPLVVALAASALAALVVTRLRRHLALALGLSGVGFSLAVAYELLGAPDVALVAVVIETLFMLLFVAVFALLPRAVLRRESRLAVAGTRRFRDPLVGAISGVLVLLVVWAALSRPTPTDASAERQLELAGAAHGKDVVTVILADFRGLDTLVEVTVVVVALLGVAALLRRGKLW